MEQLTAAGVKEGATPSQVLQAITSNKNLQCVKNLSLRGCSSLQKADLEYILHGFLAFLLFYFDYMN